jgi:hypothetical protein
MPCDSTASVIAFSSAGPTGSPSAGPRSVCRNEMFSARRVISGPVGAGSSTVSRARWAGSAGSGSRVTLARQPCAASASRAWCSAVPQLSVARRPSGSVTSRSRSPSVNRSIVSPLRRQRHGWVLWIDGA